MNDLVSEYQQYQDATAEGKFEREKSCRNVSIILVFLQKKAKVVKKKANKKVPKSTLQTKTQVFTIIIDYEKIFYYYSILPSFESLNSSFLLLLSRSVSLLIFVYNALYMEKNKQHP